MSLLLAFLMIAKIQNKIHFFSPESLLNLYTDSSMKYNILNMGDIPYGRSIIG
jgi:hypothetical protein